jgi:ankyrin repeat protein
MFYSGLRIAIVLLFLYPLAQGQADDSTFVQGRIEADAGGLRIATESDHSAVKILNPETLRYAQDSRVLLHGVRTKHGIRAISAARIDGSKDSYNSALVEMAAYRRDAAMVGHLLQLGADPNSKTYEGSPALLNAIQTGLIGSYGATPSLEIATLLLDHGADPNAMDNDWTTPLMAAAFSGDERILKVLLDHKANPNIGTRGGMTALIWARGVPAVKLLLSSGAYVNDKDVTGKTALYYATQRADQDVVKALIEGGANVNLKDDKETSALHLANLEFLDDFPDKRFSDAHKKRVQSVIDLLLAAGALPDHP